jgi:hypothetical protein
VKLRNSVSCTVLPVEAAIESLNAILDLNYRPVQIPWNKSHITKGLQGDAKNYDSWIISINDKGSGSLHLVTVYSRIQQVRLIKDIEVQLNHALLTEVFPPLTDSAATIGLIRKLSQLVMNRGYDSLQICAMNDALQQACNSLGLDSHLSKSMSVAVNDLAPELVNTVNDPSNWWCRAFNEEQLKETSYKMKTSLF